jgi:hypothetical protein
MLQLPTQIDINLISATKDREMVYVLVFISYTMLNLELSLFHLRFENHHNGISCCRIKVEGEKDREDLFYFIVTVYKLFFNFRKDGVYAAIDGIQKI